MFKHLPSLKALHAFESAARHRSFSEAAAELALSQGAISYQVKKLESGLGKALFHRRTRQVDLTADGERLYRAVHRLLRELDEEIRQITPARQETLLTVSVSTYFVTRWLSRRLGDFLNSHPGITLRLQHSVNNPDFTVDEVDLAIRWGDGGWPQTHSELLIEMPMIAVCAPALVKGQPGLRRPGDLERHNLLHDQAGTDCWPQWLQQAGIDPASVPGGPVIVDPNVRVQSAIDGHGVVLANPLVSTDIDAGRLLEPFDIRLDGMGYYLVCALHSVDNPAIDMFRRWLRREAGLYIADRHC